MQPLLPRRGVGASFALALLLTSGVASAERPVVYRWVDENGVPHFTTQRDRIPGDFRDAAQEVGRPAVVAPAPVETVTRPPAPPPAPSADVPIPEPATPPPIAAPAPSTPPAIVSPTPAPAPRVVPEGDFDEAPLGSPSTPSTPTPEASRQPEVAPTTAPEDDTDVAAPPPGFVRETANPPERVRAPAADRASREDPALVAPIDPTDSAALDDRIEGLEAEVDRDQTALQDILSQPRPADGTRVAEREDFREIAKRLPAMQADLKALRAQRAGQREP